MLRKSIIFFVASLAPVFAQNTPLVTITSATDASECLAPEALATATGTNLALGSAKAVATPWPTFLGGVTIQVTDSASVSRAAGLLSQTRINVPLSLSPRGAGVVNVTVTVNGVTSNPVQIAIM